MANSTVICMVKLLKAFKILICLCLIITTKIHHANPEEGLISFGSASININESQLEVKQYSNAAIIDWQSFDIASYEQTKFVQPSSNAIALNRIHSDVVSTIDGELIANGKLILINQNGILFDKNAKVDVNGFLATTTNINNNNFINQFTEENSKENQHIANSVLIFDQPGAKNSKIINNGEIIVNGGSVSLVAPTVTNAGIIVANKGKVNLISGETFTLDLYGDNLINIAVAADLGVQVLLNSGSIIADGNQINLTAAAGKQIINSLIINSGALQARSVANNNGEIIIMAEGSNAVPNNDPELKGKKVGRSQVIVSGLIDVAGLSENQSGGNIKVLADCIDLSGKAMITASGYTGKVDIVKDLPVYTPRLGAAGGEILIGGDYLGTGNIPTAIDLNIDSEVTINSDSLASGDAGRIIFWSDGVTTFKGKVSARALDGLGTNYGNGGFVEISGKKELKLDSGLDLEKKYQVLLSAANGSAGTLFLDPTSITIDNDFITNNNVGNIIVAADDVIFDLAANVFNIGDDFNFTITAHSSINVTSGGSIFTKRTTTNGNITIDSSQAVGAPIDLTNIIFNAQNGGAVTITTAGTITLGNINAGTMIARTFGATSDIVIPSNKQINVTGAANPLILIAGGSFINQNVIGFNPLKTLDSNARWLLYSGDYYRNVGNKKTHIGNYSALYEQVYNANALPTQTGNLVIYSISKNLSGSYDNKTVLPPSGYSKKLVTVNNITLVGTDASNYKLVNSNNTSQTSVQGYVGSVTPKELVVTLDVTKKITKTYDTNTTATLTDQNYILYDIVTNDDVGLVNHTVGTYAHNYADTYVNSVAINGVANALPVNYQKVSVSGIALKGNDYINYHLHSANLSADNIGHIDPLNVNVSLTGKATKTYDRTTTLNPSALDRTNNFSISPAIYNADVSKVGLSFSQVNYQDKDVGNNKAITVADLALTGSSAGNYKLVSNKVSGAIGTINPKPIAVTLTDNNGQDVVEKTYDATTAATVYHKNYSLDGSYQDDDLFLNNK